MRGVRQGYWLNAYAYNIAQEYLSSTAVNRIVEMDNDHAIPHVLRDDQVNLVVVSILKSFFDVDASFCFVVEQLPIVLH